MSGLVVETNVSNFNESIGNLEVIPAVALTATPLSSVRTNSYIVLIQAKIGNLGVIRVGGPGLTAANGIVLNPNSNMAQAGGDITVNCKNLQDIFIMSSFAGEGANVMFWRPL